MNTIKTATFIKSSSQISECPEHHLPEYAFIGRSNVGKSSLINALTNNGKLAKVSSKPGKTKLINHFLIDDEWYLVDLPGYGWAQTSKTEKAKWKKMTHEFFEQRQNLTCVFVLIDSRHEPQKIDIEFVNYLGELMIPIALIFTKTDKLGSNKSHGNMAIFRKVLKKTWEEIPPCFASSVISGEGKDQIIGYIKEINEQIKKG